MMVDIYEKIEKAKLGLVIIHIITQRTSSDFNENQPKHQNRNFLKTFCNHFVMRFVYYLHLRVRAFFHKTVQVCHVYCNFKIGFTCRITVIFGTLKDGRLLISTLASNICFSYRNKFQNGVEALSKIVDAFFVKKLQILSSSDYSIMFKFC